MMENTLAFSINDPDFKDFLPTGNEEIMDSRWTDFNIHDPGVTTLETIKFSMEDLIYKYHLPIEDILQGKTKNALFNWNLSKLHTQYAISENDYRRVACSFENVQNAVILPVEHANTPNNPAILVCLMQISIAHKIQTTQNHLGRYDQRMLKNRAVGEYFNRQEEDQIFARDWVTNVDVNVRMTYRNGLHNETNESILREKLAYYLLPELEPLNFRNLASDGQTITDAFEGPNAEAPSLDRDSINPTLLHETCYRKYIVVGKLYEVIQNLPFVESVEAIELKISGDTNNHYSKTVLNLDKYTFTRLEHLYVNHKEVKEIVSAPGVLQDKLLRYPGSTMIIGNYRNLGDFKSLQLSFPQNYGLGHNIVPHAKIQLDRTANFRTFLAMMDQVRGDVFAQMENLSNVFSILPNKEEIATEDLSHNIFYEGLGIPKPEESNEEIKNLFEEQRLNYLLALNGCHIDPEIPYLSLTQDILKIKQDYLLVVNLEREEIEEVNKSLNPIFRAISIVLLQERIKTILSTDVAEVRILEHCFLQPAANHNIGLNFELSVFIFPKDSINLENPSFDKLFTELVVYTQNLVNSFVPAHLIAHIHWVSESVTDLDCLLKQAYPPDQTFYFDAPLTNQQLEAMTQLIDNWILKKVIYTNE